VIPYAEDAVVASIMYGKPSTLKEPLDPLGAFLEDLAYLYSKEEHKQIPPEGVGEGLKRVKARTKSRQDKS
jgi:hypothetical protein